MQSNGSEMDSKDSDSALEKLVLDLEELDEAGLNDWQPQQQQQQQQEETLHCAPRSPMKSGLW